MKKVIELIRVSTAGQAASDRASIPAQKTLNAKTAKAYGLTIIETIEMSDVSGAAVLDAPEIQDLMKRIASPEVHGVVAREFSRLMRPENFDDYRLLQHFVNTNTILYLPEGPIDFGSKIGRLLGTIRAAIAGMERTEILERVWAAKEEKRRVGGFAQSPACLPYGVTFKNDRWSYTPESVLVQDAFRAVKSGEPYATIAQRLGVSVPGLRCILRNPIYTGWRVIDKKRDTSAAGKYPERNGRQSDRRKINRAPEDIIRVKVLDPLISESDFAAVQRIMDLKKANHWRSVEGYKHRFTYNGFLKCSCGGPLYTKFRRADYYVCKNKCGIASMRRDRLEPKLDRLFGRRLTDPSFLKRNVLTPLEERENQPKQDLELIEAQIESLRAKQKRVLDTFFDGLIDATERDNRIAPIRAQIQAFESMQPQSPPSLLTAEVLADVFSPFTEYDMLGRDDKRRLLNVVAPSVIVANYEIAGLWIGLNETHRDKDSSPPPT